MKSGKYITSGRFSESLRATGDQVVGAAADRSLTWTLRVRTTNVSGVGSCDRTSNRSDGTGGVGTGDDGFHDRSSCSLTKTCDRKIDT